MSLGFTDGAYNLASGTRNAFGALSADLVAEGLPPMVSGSGDRERADQERIWNERMTLTPGSRKTYGYRWWQGKKWWQIHPDTVAPPGTGNHEARRSNDLKWPYNSDTAAHRRAQVLAKRHNITCEGMGFREWWHWTFWGPLGTIGAPAGVPGSTTAPPPIQSEEDDDMPKNSGFIYRGATQGADQRTVLICNYGSGIFHEYTNGITSADSKYNADIAKAFDTTSFAEISASHAASIKKSLTAA